MDEKNNIFKPGPSSKQNLLDSTKNEFKEVDMDSVKSQVWKYFLKNKKEGLAKCKTCDVVLKAVQSTTATTSVANDFFSKLVEEEMHLYKIYPKERPRYLQLLYKALKTIKPTSVEAERAFSAMGFFVNKLRNRMSDKTLDELITMRQHYKKPKKTSEDDSDYE